jgi:hypothetical protein
VASLDPPQGQEEKSTDPRERPQAHHIKENQVTIGSSYYQQKITWRNLGIIRKKMEKGSKKKQKIKNKKGKEKQMGKYNKICFECPSRDSCFLLGRKTKHV